MNETTGKLLNIVSSNKHYIQSVSELINKEKRDLASLNNAKELQLKKGEKVVKKVLNLRILTMVLLLSRSNLFLNLKYARNTERGQLMNL